MADLDEATTAKVDAVLKSKKLPTLLERAMAPLEPLPADVLNALRQENGAAILKRNASIYDRKELFDVLKHLLRDKYPEARDVDGKLDERIVAQALTAISLLEEPPDRQPWMVPYLLTSIEPHLKGPSWTVKERAGNAYINVARRNNMSDEAATFLAPIVLADVAETEPIVRFWGLLDSPKALAIATDKLRQLEGQLPQAGTKTDSEGRVQVQRPLMRLIDHMHLLHRMKRPEAIEQWSQLMTRLRAKYSGDPQWEKITRTIVNYSNDGGTPWLPAEVKASLLGAGKGRAKPQEQ